MEKGEARVTKEVSGIVIDGRQWSFVGIPTEAFVVPPSPFGDQKDVPLYLVEKTELHPEWGFISYRQAHKFPFKGIVTPEILQMVNIAKRRLRSDAEFAVKKPHYWAWNLLIPWWRKKFLWDVAELYAEYSFHFLRRFYIKADWNCPCVREFYRTCQKIFWNSPFTEKQRWIIDKIVLAFGMMMECDDSYRYRVQDIFGELNKEKFFASPAREISRLMGILQARGIDAHAPAGVPIPDGVAERIRPLALILRVAFVLFPSWKRKAVQFVKEINLEKMKLDEGDRYYCMIRPDYRFGGIPFEQRLAHRKVIDQGIWDKNPVKQFIEEST